MKLRAFAALLVSTVVISCGPASSKPASAQTQWGVVDCGQFDAGHGSYDERGADCFWTAYKDGRPVRWSVKQVTIEGDPVPGSIAFDPTTGVTVARDMSADKFSAPTDRRVWRWQCAAVARRARAMDASRFFFALSGCTGDGATTAFP